MKGLFDLDYWPIYLGKKLKAFSIWFHKFKDFTNLTIPLRFLWFLLTRKKARKNKLKTPLPDYIGYWRYLIFKQNKKIQFKTVVTFALISLLFFGATSLGAVYFFKHARADQFARTAKSALQNKDFRTAFLTAHSAHLIKKEDINILRTLVSSAQAVDHFRSLEWSLKLANRADASLDDQMIYLRLCIEQKHYEEVINWLDQTTFPPERTLDSLYLRSMILALRDTEGEYEAIALIQACLSENPNDEKFCHLLWEISLKSSQENLIEEGLTHMRNKAEGRDNLAKHALRRLILHPSVSPNEKKEYSQKIWALPNCSLSDAVLSIHGSIGSKKLKGSLLMEFLSRQFDEVKTAESQELVISLLNQIGRSDTVVDLMKMKDNTTAFNKDKIISLIKASLSNGDTRLFRDLYYDHEELLTDIERKFFEILLRLKIGLTRDIGNEVIGLLQLAKPEEIETIRRFLFFIESDQTILSFVEQVHRKKIANQEVRYLLASCYQRLADQKNLYQVLSTTNLPAKIISFQGEQQTCYLKALNGLNLENCLRWAEHAFTKVPQSHALCYTLALCYLRMDDPSSALSVIRPLLLQPPPKCPSQRTIAAWTIMKNGQPKLALQWVPIEYEPYLLPPEREIIEEIMAVQL